MYKLRKLEDGSVFSSMEGTYFTIMQLEDIIKQMKELSNNSLIIEGKYEYR